MTEKMSEPCARPAPEDADPWPNNATCGERGIAMPLKTHSDEPPTLNLTPMIDVVFLLIIFFMVGTKFSELERKIGLRVPEVSKAEALTAAPEPRVVNVYRDGCVTLDRTPVTLQQLTRTLAAATSQYSDLGVLVRGDADGIFQRVAEVLNACKQADVRQLGISVRPAPEDSKQ
jgi:biopolymer transport protein ExbD